MNSFQAYAQSIDCIDKINRLRRRESQAGALKLLSSQAPKLLKEAFVAHYAEKDVPQPQVAVALGLVNLKPPPCRPVTKSMTVPLK